MEHKRHRDGVDSYKIYALYKSSHKTCSGGGLLNESPISILPSIKAQINSYPLKKIVHYRAAQTDRQIK